jgi:hypothetical protein
MGVVRMVLLAVVLAAATACGARSVQDLTVQRRLDVAGRITRDGAPFSLSGSAAHGEWVKAPSGTVNDWSILISPREMGAEEARSEEDNRLLAFRVFAVAVNDSSWQVTAQYRFGYALDNRNVHWVNGTANYLLVPR